MDEDFTMKDNKEDKMVDNKSAGLDLSVERNGIFMHSKLITMLLLNLTTIHLQSLRSY